MQSKKACLIAVLCLVTASGVYAKLPAPSDEAKAKAAEAKEKAAEAAKKDAADMGKAQDRITDRYVKAQKAKGVIVKPTPIVVGGPANAAAPQPAVGAAATPATAAAPQLAKK